VIIRGIERKAVFKDDTDRFEFVERIESIFSETRAFCFSRTLMPNHMHFLSRNADAPPVTLMRRLLTGY